MVKCIDKYVCGSVGGSKFWKYLLLLDAILCNILNSSACGFKKVFDQTLVLTQAIEKAHKAVNHSRNRKEEPIGKIQEVDKDWITTSHLRQTIESNIRQEAYKKDGFDIISDIFSLPPMMQYTLVDLLDLATAQIATGVRIDITLTLPIETPSQDTETITMNLNISGMTSSSKESRRNCSIGVSSSGDGSVDGESECSSEILLPSYATPPVKSVSTATEKQDICLELPHHELSYSTTSEACAIKSSVDSFKDPDIFVDNFSYDSSRNSERNDKLVFFPTTSVAPESLLIKFVLEDSQFAGKKRPIQSVGKCEENVEPKTGRQLTPAEYKRSVDSSIISTLPLTNECRNKGTWNPTTSSSKLLLKHNNKMPHSGNRLFQGLCGLLPEVHRATWVSSTCRASLDLRFDLLSPLRLDPTMCKTLTFTKHIADKNDDFRQCCLNVPPPVMHKSVVVRFAQDCNSQT